MQKIKRTGISHKSAGKIFLRTVMISAMVLALIAIGFFSAGFFSGMIR